MAKTIESIGLVTNKSVLKCTKKSWLQWLEILNQVGAKNWTHKEIVAHLKKKYKLSPWWQQQVTIGYEIQTGRRVTGQNLKGEYSVTVTKTFPIDAKTAWKIVSSSDGLQIWLKPMSEFELKPKMTFECEGEIFGQVRTMKPGQRVRFSWQETDWEKPTVVQIFIVPRPKQNKCLIAITHENLKDGRQRLKMRQHWQTAIQELLDFVQGPT